MDLCGSSTLSMMKAVDDTQEDAVNTPTQNMAAFVKKVVPSGDTASPDKSVKEGTARDAMPVILRRLVASSFVDKKLTRKLPAMVPNISMDTAVPQSD